MNALWTGAILVGIVLMLYALVSLRDWAARWSGLLPPKGRATMADVVRLVRAGERIAAIRCYREIHRVSLAEAKKAIERLRVAN